MAAMGVLEKKAIEYVMAGDHRAAADIYEKLANLRLDVNMACDYIECTMRMGRVKDSLKMVDKYVNLLKWAIKPEYKNFYLQASIASFSGSLREESLYFAKRAEECAPDDDFVLFQRVLCENMLGVMDNVRAHEKRLLNFCDNYARGDYGDDMFIPPMTVATWFEDNELLYRVSRQSAARLNNTPNVFEHMPTIDHFTKEKIKVGYLSAHVRNHPAMNGSWNRFQKYNSDRFETHGFFHGADYSYDKAKRFAQSFDGYSDLDDMTDFEAAQYIKDMDIDILVDLSSMVEGARSAIVAHKPAPIIMQYQGYLGTTCIDAIDYKITDRYTSPLEEAEYYSEKFAYLPGLSYDRTRCQAIDKSLQDRSRWGIPDDAFVFANMCTMHKYTPEMMDAWMTIVYNVENSVLWLAKAQYDDTKTMINFYADKHGIDRKRIIIDESFLDYDSHMSRLPCIDVHLDTNIFCGHSTTVDMIEMGVFPLCMTGNHFNSRFSASLMNYIGGASMVTKDIDEYIKTAVVLGRDKDLVKTWATHVHQLATDAGLFECGEFIKDLENIYEMAYIRWMSGLQPDHFMADTVKEEDTIDLENVDVLVSQETHDRISNYAMK